MDFVMISVAQKAMQIRAEDNGRRINKNSQERETEMITQQRRIERLGCLEKDRFWVLQSSGRTVEHILFEAGLKDDASVSVRSSKELFTEAEWKEIKETTSFGLPELPPSTAQYLKGLREPMLQGGHPHSVPPPDNMNDADRYDCHLALKTAVQSSCARIYQPSDGRCVPSSGDTLMSDTDRYDCRRSDSNQPKARNRLPGPREPS
ncbi:hypothetical protein B0O80DRAFT_25228 [Mortierella sp. GBAus27b]|nr:hypothetical protein B0O80DRAFT_25228 [Mortierella sp. GBAus27b]